MLFQYNNLTKKFLHKFTSFLTNIIRMSHTWAYPKFQLFFVYTCLYKENLTQIYIQRTVFQRTSSEWAPQELIQNFTCSFNITASQINSYTDLLRSNRFLINYIRIGKPHKSLIKISPDITFTGLQRAVFQNEQHRYLLLTKFHLRDSITQSSFQTNSFRIGKYHNN